MSSLQKFWYDNLNQILIRVKETREPLEKYLRFICISGNESNEQRYMQCIEGFNDAFAKLMLSVEYEQRKVYQCLRAGSEAKLEQREIMQKCTEGVPELLQKHNTLYHQRIGPYKEIFQNQFIKQEKK